MSLCGTTKQQLKIGLLSQWKLEAEFRNSDFFATDQTLKKTFQFLLTFILHLPHCFQEKLTVEVIEVG